MSKLNKVNYVRRRQSESKIVMRLGLLFITMSCLAACGHSSDHIDLSQLRRRSEPLVGYIGHVNTTLVESQSGTVAIPPGPVKLEGWAVDNVNHTTATAMYVSVNGSPVSCEYGTPRLDVSTALKDTRYINSGYECNIPQSDLKNGSNSIEPILVGADKSYSVGSALTLQVGSH